MSEVHWKYINTKLKNKYEKIKSYTLNLISKNSNPEYNVLNTALNNLIFNEINSNIINQTNYIKNLIEIDENNIEQVKDKINNVKQIIKNIKNQFNDLIIKEKLPKNNKYKLNELIDLITIIDEILKVNIDTNIDYPSVINCLNFIEKQLIQLDKEAIENYNYYNGKIKGAIQFTQYYFTSWFVSLFTLSTYEDKKRAYEYLRSNCILSLKNYITPFKNTVKTTMTLFNKIDDILSNINTDELNLEELKTSILLIEPRIATIIEQLNLKKKKEKD